MIGSSGSSAASVRTLRQPRLHLLVAVHQACVSPWRRLVGPFPFPVVDAVAAASDDRLGIRRHPEQHSDDGITSFSALVVVSVMPATADFSTLFTPFRVAGKRLRNRITHASMSLLVTSQGHVTDRFVRSRANRAAGGAAMTVTEPLGMMRHQAGLPRVQVWRRDDTDGLKRLARGGGRSGLSSARPDSGRRARPPLSGTQSRSDRRLGASRRSVLDGAARADCGGNP